jgi:excinuclease ABC subunit A
LREIEARSLFLVNVGLDYLNLARAAGTLSGGEIQHIRLATQIGSGLVGVDYILDEPTTGLHFADVHKLTDILQKLVEGGNTVVVIEHNLDVIKTADYIIDIGPEGGDGGGTVVAQGTPEEIVSNPNSYTGHYIKKSLNL